MTAFETGASGTIADVWENIWRGVAQLPPMTASIAQALFQAGAAAVLGSPDLERKGPARLFLAGVMAATVLLTEHLAAAGSSDVTLRARLAILRDEVRPFAPPGRGAGRHSVRALAEAFGPLLDARILTVGCPGRPEHEVTTLQAAQIATLREMLADI